MPDGRNPATKAVSTSDRSTSADAGRPANDKKAQIVDAAIQVFAEKGLHGTRISEIAQRAGIAYGLVYHYFKNKEAILDSIFVDRWNEFMETLDPIVRSGRSVEEKLRAVAAAILAEHRVRPEWVTVLIFEVQRSQRIAADERMQSIVELFRLVEGILRDGQQSGELRANVDPKLASHVFVGGLDIVITSRALGLVEVDGDEQDDYERVGRSVVDLFMNGMAS